MEVEINDINNKMELVISSFQEEIKVIRTGRASVDLLQNIYVNYYGTPTQLTQLATISIPEARQILIQPWDKNLVSDINNSIRQSDLSLSPIVEGAGLRIKLPILTQERRKELAKKLHSLCEQSKVKLRNVRREFNDQVKSMKHLGEDVIKKHQSQCQDVLHKYSNSLDKIMQTKEAEIFE